MDYFTNITSFELARREEAERLVSAKRKALCDVVIAKHEAAKIEKYKPKKKK